MKKTLILIIYIFVHISFAQATSLQDKKEKLNEFNTWLNKTNIDLLFKVDTFYLDDNYYKLHLKSSMSTDTLGAYWCSFCNQYDSLYQDALAYNIFNTYRHFLNIPLDSAYIYIHDKEFFFEYSISFQGNTFHTKKVIPPCNPMSLPKRIIINEKNLNPFYNSIILKNGFDDDNNIKSIRDTLKAYFNNYFNAKQSELKITNHETGNGFIIDVKVKNEAIKNHNYHEKIKGVIDIYKESYSNKIVIVIYMDVKYAASFRRPNNYENEIDEKDLTDYYSDLRYRIKNIFEL